MVVGHFQNENCQKHKILGWCNVPIVVIVKAVQYSYVLVPGTWYIDHYVVQVPGTWYQYHTTMLNQ